MSLARLAAAIGAPVRPDWDRIVITDVCDDSRAVREGALFVAVPGAVHDGADYVRDALSAGAAAVVSERAQTLPVPLLATEDARAALARLAAAFYGRPTEALFTVGVTGTNGKTTVCHWIAHVLGADRAEVIGTVANDSRGLPAVTTPSSPIVQRIAAEARDAGRQFLIIEASSIGLEQRRLDEVDFDVGVFTNLTRDHLDLHGTMDAYLGAKRTLFRGLAASADAVVNHDDPASGPLLLGSRAAAVRYGFGAGADLRALDVEVGSGGTRCTLAHSGDSATLTIAHPGVHNMANALAAACVGLVRGMPLAEVAGRLAGAPAVEGRLQAFVRPDGVRAVIDFAHTPDALRRALDAVRPAAGRLLVVFGCPGKSDLARRPTMGDVAGRFADWTVLTSDNPKHEDPVAILEQIEDGLRPTGARWERIVDRRTAVARAVARARPGDVVLLAGKGHERYQIVGDEFVPYSDRAALEELGFVASCS